MPRKKRQHYVPRFYLRRFAADLNAVDPRRIGLYHIRRGLLIPNASIRDQCAKDDFYGATDTIEDAFGILEGHWATLLRAIAASTAPPVSKSDGHVLFLFFVAMQMLRTNQQRSSDNIRLNQLLQSIYAHHDDTGTTKHNQLDWVAEDPVAGLRVFQPMAWHINDLKMSLIHTAPAAPFLTSDNPVFKYNLYCEGITSAGITGATHRGLLIFVPIAPELLLLMYDGDVYKVGKPGSNHLVEATSEDAHMFNSLQYVGADENLYFSSRFSLSDFRAIDARFRKAREQIGPRTIEASDVGGSSNVLIHQYNYTPNLHMSLSFLSIRRRPRRVSMAERARAQRRPLLGTTPATVDDLASQWGTFMKANG